MAVHYWRSKEADRLICHKFPKTISAKMIVVLANNLNLFQSLILLPFLLFFASRLQPFLGFWVNSSSGLNGF
jgi:hypothetical protein